MSLRPTLFFSLVTAFVTAACQGRNEPTATLNHSAGATLIGAWDIEMRMDESYALAPEPPKRRSIRGTLGFVGGGEFDGAGSSSEQPGVYDLRVSELGLGWIGSDPFPAAVGTVHRIRNSSGGDIDSVYVVLNPRSPERIRLSGQRFRDEIRGRWIAESARGYEKGTFTMRAHAHHAVAPAPVVRRRYGSRPFSRPSATLI